mmetsp:Transcript_30041/g.34760  ORF Transcript_30041/g.34760 Transcript_30041/m.34760 type:complete len:669 (+) Transcript_30041:3-2009(+)
MGDDKDSKPRDYMESKLQDWPSSVLNDVKKDIRTLFPYRDCQFLTRPSKEKQIENVHFDHLDPSFIQGINTLIGKIRNNIMPKKIGRKTLTGSMFLSLVFEYIDTLNRGDRIELLPTVERVVYSETRKLYDEVRVEYQDVSEVEFDSSKLPIEEDDMIKTFRQLSQSYFHKFEEMVKEIAETEQFIELRSRFSEEILEDFESKKTLNHELSLTLCKDIINHIFGLFAPPDINSIDDIRESTLREYKARFTRLYEDYIKESKGPFKHAIFADMMPGFLFDFFDRYHKDVVKVMEARVNQLSFELKESQNDQGSFQNIIKDHESLIFELQKQVEHYKDEVRKNIRQLTNELKKKELGEDHLKGTIKELETKNESKKSKIKNLKASVAEFETTIEGMKNEKKETQKKVHSLELKVTELQKTLEDMRSGKQPISGSNESAELSGLFTKVQSQIDGLKHLIVDKNALGGKSVISEQLLEKEKEIAEIKETNQKVQAGISEDFKKKLLAYKEKHAEEKAELTKKLEALMTENSELKLQLINLNNSAEVVKKNQQLIEVLTHEKSTLQESIATQQAMYQTALEVLNIHKNEVVELKGKIGQLEMELQTTRSNTSLLRASKIDLIFAMKEAIKKALKEKRVIKTSHSLRFALEQLSKEDADEIRSALKEVDVNVDY